MKKPMSVDEAKALVAAAKEKKENPGKQYRTVFIDGLPVGNVGIAKDVAIAYGVQPSAVADLSFVGDGVCALVTPKKKCNETKETLGKQDDLKILPMYNPLLNKFTPQLGPHPAAAVIMLKRLDYGREKAMRNKDGRGLISQRDGILCQQTAGGNEKK